MKHKPFPRLSVPLALIVGTTAGVLVTVGCMFVFSLIEQQGSTGFEKLSVDSSHPEGTRSGESDSNRDTKSESNNQSQVLRNLDDIVQTSSNFERRSKTIKLVENAKESELLTLMDQLLEIDSTSTTHSVLATILQKYATIQPKRAVQRLKEVPKKGRSGVVSAVFEELASTNLDKAISLAKSLSEQDKQTALWTILRTRDELSDTLKAQVARQLGHKEAIDSLATVAYFEEDIEDPEAAWKELTENDFADVRNSARLSHIAKTWIAQEGIEVLDKIVASLKGNQIMRWTLLSTVLDDVMESDPSATFQYVLSMKSDPNNSILSTVIQQWATKDPKSALSAVQSIDASGLRRNLQRNVVQVWAMMDPHGVLRDINLVEESMRLFATETAIKQVASSDPEEAVLLLASVDNQRSKLDIAITIASNWAYRDPHAALEWVLGNTLGDASTNNMLRIVLSSLAAVDPNKAMTTALSQPIAEGEIGLEAGVVASIAQSNVDQALELLGRVRSGPTKNSAMQSIGVALMNEGRTDEALALATELSGQDQLNYYSSVVSSWASYDPEGLLVAMERLPSGHIRSQAAFNLVINNQWQRALTDEQIEEAKQFLSPEYAQVVDRIGSEVSHMGWSGSPYMIEGMIRARSLPQPVTGNMVTSGNVFIHTTTTESVEQDDEDD